VNTKLKRGVQRAGLVLVLTLLVTLFLAAGSVFAAGATSVTSSWSFGVMADTQWTTTDPASANPNGVAVSIINQINQQFIQKGVKFVIQVGDLTESGADADVAVRATAAQALYNKGIGFFPMRGNHETYTPGNGYAIAAFRSNFPQTRGLSNTFGAANFTSPTLGGSYPNDLQGMSYSFDFGSPGSNARFVIIDEWATPNKLVTAAGYSYGYSVGDQQSWLSSMLDQETRGTEHVFVFSHQNLMGENHQDSLFAGYTDANPAMQNAFFASLDSNGVRYAISGHDHVHQRSIITSPDGLSRVEELICASNSSKFYTPKSLSDAKWYGQKVRETSIQQELYTIGYYIFTVSGPRVTVDYYADDHGNWQSDGSYPSGPANAGSRITPTLNFVKKATWGYSTNGCEFLVGGTLGSSYTTVQDTFGATTARILSGDYANNVTDYTNRVLTQTVDTGWSLPPVTGLTVRLSPYASDVLTLWGMAPLGAAKNVSGRGQTATYALSLSYRSVANMPSTSGKFGIATLNSRGAWVNAVDQNVGGTKRFVSGPWNSSYGLGTYGVDPATKTAWAVLNYNADFVVANGLVPPAL
jgi:hypothetical protein